MEFKDYNNIIKQNRKSLIDSYVAQYGEEQRSFIEKRFDDINFCFYENPRKLEAYINKKSADLGQKYTIEFLEQAGFDISKVYIDKNGFLTSDDIAIKRIIHAFFPQNGYMSINNDGEGIFCFSNEYSEDTEFNLLRKGLLLAEMNYIKNPKDITEFKKTEQYAVIEEMIKTLLPLAKRYKQKLSANFVELISYQKELADKENKICEKNIREFVLNFNSLLTKDDREALTNNQNCDLKKLKSISNICNINEIGDVLPLDSGLIEYFLPGYTLELNSESITEERKKFILSKRLEFLRINNINIDLKDESVEQKLISNWEQISELRKLIPNITIVKDLKVQREAAQKQCLEELVPIYVINGYKFKDGAINNQDLKNILYLGDSQYGCRCIINDDVDLTVYIAPLDGNYKGIDVILDYQIRHALEFSSTRNTLDKDMFGVKKGSIVQFVKVGLNCIMYINGMRAGQANTNINEIMAQKLSLESTENRYNDGVFILVEPEDAILKGASIHGSFIDNFDIAFPSYIQEKMLQSRINCDNLNSLYEIAPQKILTQIDNIITNNDEETRDKLDDLRMQMAVRYSFH